MVIASIFFNFGSGGTGETYYWDDLVFGNLTAIHENIVNEIKLYPNPAKQELHICTKGSENITEVWMYSLNGNIVIQARPVDGTLDISTLQPGMYIVEVMVEGRKMRRKLLVQ